MEVQSVSSTVVAQQMPPAANQLKKSDGMASPPVKEEGATVVDAAQVQGALDNINQVIQVFNKDVQFSVDESTGIDVVQVVDRAKDEVIRQLPIDAVLSFARTLDTLQGLLIKQRI